ncbi:rCG56542 [Rattus norvegicus]|uniref:RCG56542 n=1 Tax=Rattus norvegicus TaxID=10116 RepID=A6IB30_RAT|nr:rCG56542 [Rattus norvegicus]
MGDMVAFRTQSKPTALNESGTGSTGNNHFSSRFCTSAVSSRPNIDGILLSSQL